MSTEGATQTRKPSGRGKAVLAIDWHPRELPGDTKINLHTLITHDGDVTRGTLYCRSGQSAKSVVCLMHPRQDMQRHPAIPGLLEAGHAVWAQTSRVVGNDLTLVHETALLDVAAGMEMLRDSGYEQIVLAGISGGAGLYSFYTEQSLTAPAERIAKTPFGGPVPLPEAPMPAPDGLVLIAPHPGQGKLLLSCIDPSVIDEFDPLTTDDSLDPYNPENGFSDEGSTFTEEFLARYRRAQHDRVQRIDQRAQELNAARIQARKRFKSDDATELDRRGSILTPIITTYRTDADPRTTDLSLDANDRRYGSVISAKPSMSNFGAGGFGRLTTPESWLSTWSGLSSNASVERSLAKVTVPTMIIEYTGDCSVFPSDIENAKRALAATDVRHEQVRCTHFAGPIERGEPGGTKPTVDLLVEWVGSRGG